MGINPNEILVRYGEIFTKSERVRKIFEKVLVENIKLWLKKEKVKFKIYGKRGRIFIITNEIKKTSKILKKIFGIVSFSPCLHLETCEKNKIIEFFRKNYGKFIPKNNTFAIEVRRVGQHDYTSQELAKGIGNVIKRKVDLSNPDIKIFVEVRNKDTYIYIKKISGLGGLPVGVSGKVVSLISGGIDSPVASWLVMKRGCKVIFVHFHSFPLVTKASIEKTKELVKILSSYQGKSKVYFVPFSKIQIKIKASVPAKYRVIFYRRAMLKIAEKIAKLEKAKAIVTGESLAQVSSQTIENIAIIEEVTKMPILRPLIGMDKEEIIRLAKKIKTYDISIKPQEDCCTLFVPKHASAKANPEIVRKLDKKLKLKKLFEEVIDRAEVVEIKD